MTSEARPEPRRRSEEGSGTGVSSALPVVPVPPVQFVHVKTRLWVSEYGDVTDAEPDVE
jgi:hypothetical protein